MGDNASEAVLLVDGWVSSGGGGCPEEASCGGLTPVAGDFGGLSAHMALLLTDLLADPYHPWLFSLLASLLIGLSGIFPLLVIPIEAGHSLKSGAGARTLKKLLSFAVGGLLADVFLHLLPEAWKHLEEGDQDPHNGHLKIGLWVLAGIFAFILVEMMVQREEDKAEEEKLEEHEEDESGKLIHNGCIMNGKTLLNNNHPQVKKPGGFANGCCLPHNHSKSSSDRGSGTREAKPAQKQIAGYLNLVANSIDNFAHGLAVAGSFLVGPRVGLVTTAAILLHEVPHELGDFAILLRAGFDRWAAARAQLATATVGILGALAALTADDCQSLSDKTAWILPFTSGGFINIALVNVLPDLLKEDDPMESVKQLGSFLGGVGVIALVTVLCV